MPPKAADKGDKMFSADVVAAVLYSTGTTSLSKKNYEMMSALDGKKSACGFQHDFRSVIAKAKELKARVDGGKVFKPVPSSAKRVPSAPASTTKKRKNALDSDVDETPSKTRKTKKEGTPTSQANLATDSFEDYMNSLPDGADAFIMGERHWEEENLYA